VFALGVGESREGTGDVLRYEVSVFLIDVSYSEYLLYCGRRLVSPESVSVLSSRPESVWTKLVNVRTISSDFRSCLLQHSSD
jgi:hypothetical protein